MKQQYNDPWEVIAFTVREKSEATFKEGVHVTTKAREFIKNYVFLIHLFESIVVNCLKAGSVKESAWSYGKSRLWYFTRF